MKKQKNGLINKTTANSPYKKLEVQWLNQVLCINQNSCKVDSEVLRNRLLLVATKRYGQVESTLYIRL